MEAHGHHIQLSIQAVESHAGLLVGPHSYVHWMESLRAPYIYTCIHTYIVWPTVRWGSKGSGHMGALPNVTVHVQALSTAPTAGDHPIPSLRITLGSWMSGEGVVRIPHQLQ